MAQATAPPRSPAPAADWDAARRAGAARRARAKSAASTPS